MREVTLSPADLLALSTDVLDRGGLFRFQARGGSMRPAIQDGDTLILGPVSPDALAVGNVVLYLSDTNQPIVHRIIAHQENPPLLTIRGDAQTGPGERVPPDRVIGRVIDIQRGSKKRLTPILRLAAASLRRLQSLSLYRMTARQLVGGRVTYRPALPSDVPALARLYGISSAANPANNRLVEHLPADQGIILLACLGNQITGAATLRRFPPAASHYPDWWLFDLQVRLRYRGLGFGEGLTRASLASAAARDASRVHLLVFAAEKPAIRLYEKLGFCRSTIPGLSEVLAQEAKAGGRPRLIMTLHLDPPEST